jgi:hypothetical protein
MRPQSKRRRQRGPPQQPRYLIGDVRWRGPGQQSDLKGGPGRQQNSQRQRVSRDLRFHRSRREQNSAVRVSRGRIDLDPRGPGSVEVFPSLFPGGGVSCPEGERRRWNGVFSLFTSTSLDSERTAPLPEAVERGAWDQRGGDLDVALPLEDEAVPRGVE